jgi:hypothetical protein
MNYFAHKNQQKKSGYKIFPFLLQKVNSKDLVAIYQFVEIIPGNIKFDFMFKNNKK